MNGDFSIKRTLRMIFLDLLIFICLFGIGETYLRMFQPSLERLIYTDSLSGGHPIIYNSLGLRDIEFPSEKPAGENRILILGNSTTFGSGVAMEDTYPKQLEKILGPPYRVINAGGQGSSLPESIAFLKETGFDFKPDLIVLGFSPPMIGKTKLQSGQAGFSAHFRNFLLNFHRAFGNSYLYAALDHYGRKNLYGIGVLRDDLSVIKGAVYAYGFDAPGVDMTAIQGDYETFFALLQELRDLSAKQDIPLIVLGMPSSFELGKQESLNPRAYPLDKIRISPLDKIAEAAKKIEIPFIDLRDALKSREDAYIPGDYAHLSKQGHLETARFLAKELQWP